MKIPYDPRTRSIGGAFSWAQDPYIDAIESQYNAGKPVRVIVLKARQLGLSTITEGVLFNWLFIHPGTHALVLAHETDTSEELFNKSKTFWETWPFNPHYHLRYATKQNMHWLETGSQLKIATAGNRMSGRGHTTHAVHLSEVAFYPDPKTMMLGLNQSIPEEHGTIAVIESTANGVGNYFYEFWNRAVDGESDYIPLFFPWWKHPEYMRQTGISRKSDLDVDERNLYRMMAKDSRDEDWIFPHLEWRRFMLANKVADEEQFMQEYPATPEEAFRTSGTPVFNHSALSSCYHDGDCVCGAGMVGFLREVNGRMQFIRDRGGPLRVFKTPSVKDRSSQRYFVGATANESIYGGNCTMQVIRRDTNEQVATFIKPIDPGQFGYEIMKVGRYYNDAMVCPEAEGTGSETISVILEAGYPNVWLHTWADKAPGKKSSNFGWSMNLNRKKWAVSRLMYLFNNNRILIHDRETYSQMRDYSYWFGQVEMGNADPDGDDSAVMALAIAVRASASEAPYIPQSQTIGQTLDFAIHTENGYALV